ncbi:murein biosynthesis integral membrane protein MurJ [Candidatus Fermentibacteria bacterium]|nr:murein biosynthesis integral membrane protein MurJ [Candidatus Fermentibacteria bacterium]
MKGFRNSLSWIYTAKKGGPGLSFLSSGRLVVTILSYLRQMLIASYFGLSWKTDAYSIALIVPFLIRRVVTNSFEPGFVPILADVIERKGLEEGKKLVNRLLFWAGVSGFLLAGLLVLLGHDVVSMVGPGLDDQALELATVMVLIMLPMIFLFQINGFLLGYLTYQQRFGLQAFIGVLELTVALVTLVVGQEFLGILALPLSSMVSVVVSFLVLAFLVMKTGFSYRLVVDPRGVDLRALMRMTFPVVGGTVFSLLGPITDKILASFLGENSVTALTYADRIKEIALLVFLVPLQKIIGVRFSKRVAKKEIGLLKSDMADTMGWTSFAMFPAAVILTLLASPLVALLFQRGSFTASNSRLVGYALAFYAPWLAQFGFGGIARRAFFALKDTVTPVLTSVWALIVNVLLNFILIGPLGIGGLALATTLSSTGKSILVVYFLRKKMGSINGARIAKEQLKLLAAAGGMIASVFALTELVPSRLTDPFWHRLGSMLVWLVSSSIVYLVIAAVLKARVALDLLGRVRKIGRSRPWK